MNVVKLQVGGSLPGDLTFEMTRDGRTLARGETQVDFTLKDLTTDPASLERLLPLHPLREMQQWVYDEPSPGLLAIISEDSDLDGIPWEHLSQLLQLPSVFVVRLIEQSRPIPNRTEQDQPSLLAAGWSGKPWYRLPGIQKELNALSQLAVGTDANVRVLYEPSPSELAGVFDTIQPHVLHLIPPGIQYEDQMPKLIISGVDDIELIRIDDFLSQLPNNFKPRLVVLNTCHGGESGSGPSATRVITEHLGTIAVGWGGVVQDQAAFDFALFLYNRLLLEGGTIVDALRSYRSLQPFKRNPERGTRDARPVHSRSLEAIPVVWTASLESLNESLLEPKPEQNGRDIIRGSRPLGEAQPPTQDSQPPVWRIPIDELGPVTLAEESSLPIVELDFEPQTWLNPALLKNGRPAIVELALKPDRMLRNVSLAITCDTGSGSSVVRQTINLVQGHQPVTVDVFNFPILYQLIQDNVSRRQINFTLTCRLGTALLAEMTKSALWMELSEWLDKPETWHYIPAFVDPYSSGVLDVIDKADSILKNNVSPTSAFSGYQTGDNEFVMKQVEAIFNCLRTKFELNYINPPPLPVYTPGDQTSSGQRVRSPNDVIKRKRGTCHDLAILCASCLEHIGIYPLICLIWGHTFVGFWKDAQAHQEFWEHARQNIRRRTQGPGRGWTIADIEEIRQLLQDGAICFVEATMVTDRNAEFMSAIQAGQGNLDSQKDFDVAIDVQASRREIQPL